MQNRPTWFVAVFVSALVIIALLSLALVMKLLLPGAQKAKREQTPIESEAELEKRIKKADEDGLDVRQVKQEIAELTQRRTAGNIYIAVFGEVNMGKSSIICAILPDASPSISNIAGTTQQITHYHWQSSAGDQLILADVPGTEQVDSKQLSSLARDEALRAHIVIYVCDGDLNRTQYQELLLLCELKKPTIVALNKSDVYNKEELQKIQNKLISQLPADYPIELVLVSCGRQESVVRVLANGHEEIITRPIPADVSQLTQEIQPIA